jgi:transposase
MTAQLVLRLRFVAVAYTVVVVPAAAALEMTDDERAALQRMARSSVLPHRKVVRAQALVWAGDGVANEEIARRVRVDADTVRRWRARFATSGVEGVGKIAKGRGRKPWLPPDIVARVLTATRDHTPPGGQTHWTMRSMAAHVGVGKDSVARIWADHGLKPWRIDTFKVSTDPRFEEKIVDVVGLYLDPPARAAVFSFDEKTSCQALDRTQPSLPLKRGRAATMTHDYKRHGTVDLFAAMNVATGQVHTHLRKGHAATDVLAFFKQIDTAVPRELDVHVVLDNLSAHKAPAITEWLAHPRRSRWHLHFTPTSSSWLNLIERWFKELTDKRLRRGVFTSVAELTDAITTWAEHWNTDPHPFVWKATAEDIITKVQRGRAVLHQLKTATDH